MLLKKKATLLLITILGYVSNALAYDKLTPFRNISTQRKNMAVSLAQKAVEEYITKNKTISPPHLPPPFNYPAGVFVTITKNGKVRGCMGTLYPKTPNISHEIIRSAILAATSDPFHPPIKKHELPHLKYIISIVGSLRRVEKLNELSPKHLGLLVRRGEKAGLLLPGEALTVRWQIYMCKKKAGIPQDKEVEMFVFPTVVYK